MTTPNQPADKSVEQRNTDYADILPEIAEQEAIEQADNKRWNKRIFAAIESVCGHLFLEDVLSVMDWCGCSGKCRLVNESEGDFQQENDYNIITGFWIHQTSVGFEDSFAGTVWIKLKDNMFLEADYSG